MKITIYSSAGEKTSKKYELSPAVFAQSCSEDLLAQAVRTYLANQRQGTVKTKTRSEVSGGGRKPWRQKGTGRARHGSIRSPIWVGGGVAHGPQPGARRLKLPAKMRRKAFLGALTKKAVDGSIKLLDSWDIKEPKTSRIVAILKKMDLDSEKVLVVLGAGQEVVAQSVSNLPAVNYSRAEILNTYQVLNHKVLLLDTEGLKALEDRF